MKPTRSLFILIALACGFGAGGLGFTTLLAQKPNINAVQAQPQPEAQVITSLGRLEPQGQVVNVFPTTGTVAVLEKTILRLLVEEGDSIKAGQLLAVISTENRYLSALARAQSGLRVAEAQLKQVRAGAKRGDIEAQRATVARLKAELALANTELDRYSRIFKEGAVSNSLFDSKRLDVERLREQQRQSASMLMSVAEVRPVDVALAQARVNDAQSAVTEARADLATAYVHAPRNGRVLKVYSRPGEVLNPKGILALGTTDQMYVVAEVYETDIQRVHAGQKATVTSSGFRGNLSGTVERVGLQIGKQDVLGTDPAVQADTRVVEVRIRLERTDSARVANLTNLQVQVAIHG
jgi:HlyD family secretion protein